MKEPARPVYEFGPFRLEPMEQRLYCSDRIVPLTPKALDLLTVFVEQPGHLLEEGRRSSRPSGKNPSSRRPTWAYTVSAPGKRR